MPTFYILFIEYQIMRTNTIDSVQSTKYFVTGLCLQRFCKITDRLSSFFCRGFEKICTLNNIKIIIMAEKKLGKAILPGFTSQVLHKLIQKHLIDAANAKTRT